MANRPCPACGNLVTSRDSRTRYCSLSCAVSTNNRKRLLGKGARRKISESLKAYYAKHKPTEEDREKMRRAVGKSTRGRFRPESPESILELSSRTKIKVLQRLAIGCCICGWHKAPCDLHHMGGRKIKNADHHSNLTYVCPNCHRMIHHGLIPVEHLTPLSRQVGSSWKKHYYG